MPASAPTETKSTIGSFTAEAFAAHLAGLPPLPAWWLERKRAAYERFASLPMPSDTDEHWRFSNRSTLTLEGFHLPVAGGAATATPAAPGTMGAGTPAAGGVPGFAAAGGAPVEVTTPAWAGAGCSIWANVGRSISASVTAFSFT